MIGNLYTENEKKIRTLKIGNSIYKVLTCDKLKFNNKKYFGFVDYDRKIIFLLKDKDLKETLIHEITHAFFNELFIKTKKPIYKKLRSNEFFIENISFLIQDIIKFL